MKQIKPLLWPLMFLVAGLAITGIAPAQGLDEDDVEFMEQAAMAGMFEIEAANLATSHGTHPDIRSFADMMTKDHQKLAQDLKALAMSKNVTLPSTLDEDHREKLSELSEAAESDEFDKKYAEMMIDGHDDTVETFEDTAEDAVDSEVKALAAKALPTLKMHKDQAEKLDEIGT